MTATRTVRRTFPWLAVLLTSTAVAVFFPAQYLVNSLSALAEDGTGLASTYADAPAAIRGAFYLHITFSGVALLVGGLQFSGAIRRRHPRAHRWIGRAYVASVFVGGGAAVVMAFANSLAFLGFFGFGTLALLWIWTTYRGYVGARHGDFAAHQAWMIRSFALTYAATTLRAWLVLLMAIQLPFGIDDAAMEANAYAPVAFLCWMPNLVVAEYLVHRRGLPSLINTANLKRSVRTTAGRAV